jgi:hypothetical protein
VNASPSRDPVESVRERWVRVPEKEWPVRHQIIDVGTSARIERIGATPVRRHEWRTADRCAGANRRASAAGKDAIGTDDRAIL